MKIILDTILGSYESASVVDGQDSYGDTSMGTRVYYTRDKNSVEWQNWKASHDAWQAEYDAAVEEYNAAVDSDNQALTSEEEILRLKTMITLTICCKTINTILLQWKNRLTAMENLILNTVRILLQTSKMFSL